MNMADVMKLIDQLRLNQSLSKEQFSRRIGIASKTYTRQITGQSPRIGIESVQLYAKYAQEQGDAELLQALGAYALGVPIGKIKVE